ncbi:MAG: sulfotransferase [Pseudomonadota bacterium]
MVSGLDTALGQDAARAAFDRITAMLEAKAPNDAAIAARTALEVSPNDPNILRLLGIALIRLDQAEEAIERLTHVVRLVPGFAPAHENLADAYLHVGRIDEAIASLKAALKFNPKSTNAQSRLAELLALLGRGREADEVFQSSVGNDPERAAMVEAMELAKQNAHEKAEAIYKSVLRRKPEHVDALRLLGALYLKQERHSEAEPYFRRVTELAPDFWIAWINLGVTLQDQQKFAPAQAAFETALELRPTSAHALEKLGSNAMQDSRIDDAIGYLEQALAIDEHYVPALLILGHALKTIGKQDDAIDAYRRCAAAKPSYGDVYWSLANLKTYRFPDAEVAHMKSQLETLGDSQEAQEADISFRFALGKAHEDLKQFDKAFEYYAVGNEKKRLTVNYDPIDLETQVDRLIDVFDADFFAQREGQGSQDDAPIFIVGLPRSGSTLLEQILASHSDVEGTAELHFLLRLATDTGLNRLDGIKYPQSMHLQKPHQLKALGEEYLELASAHRSGAKYFTDKLPNNFIAIGFLHAILPNAKVIDARRHPLDSCLGSFKQLFAKGQTFTYDMYDLAHYYSQYVRIMVHWDAVLPGKVLRVNYEDVVADVETQARRIAAHCGLGWQDAMLKFYDTKRAVKTASSEQVRKPIYSASRHLWRSYEDHLGELIEFLEPVLLDLPYADQPKAIQALSS